jgi:hypothetical protein
MARAPAALRRPLRALVDPQARHPARRAVAAGYGAMVGAQLAYERCRDELAPAPSPEDGAALAEVTALIKTLERPRALRRLIGSIRRWAPGMHVVVADDSRRPTEFDGVTTVALPFNSGISAGRNEGLRHVATPYVLVLDDDFVLWRHTRLADAIRELARHEAIDVMGGTLVNLPRRTRAPTPWELAAVFPTEARPVLPVGTRVGPLVVYEKVPNFFVARTDRLRLVPWEPRLKRFEHADFFTRARGVLATALNRGFSALHAPTPYDAFYMSYRLDFADARGFLDARYGST